MQNLKSQRGNPSQERAEEYKAFQCASSIAQEYLLALLRSIKNNLPHHVYSAADSTRDLKTIETRFKAEGLSFATLTLPKLSAGLFLYLETGQVCYPSFKIKKDTGHPEFLQGLFRLAYRDGEYQVEAIRAIYQISVIFKKLKGPYPDSVLSKQLADFVSTDVELGDIDLFSEPNLHIVERARQEIRRLFAGFSLDSVNVLPTPGPGATNTPVAKHLRYRPHVLYTQVDSVMPYHEYFNVHGWDFVKQTALYQKLYKEKVSEQRARLKYVHKVVGKARGICIEQNEVQYMQQAIKGALYDWIQKNPLTRGKVNFDDQSVNMELAKAASIDRCNATIDMSEASDRISRELVSWLFQDTVLHNVLMGLSTKWVDLPEMLVGKQAIKLNKYAPMGSGLCFPVMSVVHWALIRAIIAESMYDDLHIEKVYVYGDDIIIPSEITEAVYTYLPRFGMKLNKTKSYYRSHFRESCGVHAFRGADITPIFIKHLPVTSSFQAAMSCIAVESQLHSMRYDEPALLMRTGLRALFGDLPFVPATSRIFGFKRSDLRVPVYTQRQREKLDRWGNPFIRARSVVPIQDSAIPPTEEECYLRHVLTKDHVREVSGNPREFKLKWVDQLIPGTVTKALDDRWNWFIKIQDKRCERDIHNEEKYDFTKLQYRASYAYASERFRNHRVNLLRNRNRVEHRFLCQSLHSFWPIRGNVSSWQSCHRRVSR